MARLVVPMEMLAAVDYDVAAEFVQALGEAVAAGTEIVVVGVDRDRAKRHGASHGVPVPWRGSEELVAGLFRGAGWVSVVGLPPEEPWLFEVWATR